MSQLSLRVITPEAEIGTVPLPVEEGGAPCSIQLRCLPGASAIHLAFTNGHGGVMSRAEVAAAGGETVPVRVALGADREVRVWSSPGRRVLILHPEPLYEPPLPISPAAPGMSLDLVFVIDGTTRRFALQDNQYVSEPLLGRPEIWEGHVELLSRFAEVLAAGSRESRFSVLAFGDEPLRGIDTQELTPRYLLHPRPKDRQFSLGGQRLQRLFDALASIEPTPGGDFVDALGDALHACRPPHECRHHACHPFPWGERERARRIVMICGDSPGHSVLEPLCPEADIHVRQWDVDVEAEHLHREGVEIATLYFDPPKDLERQAEFTRELVGGARQQYKRLASLPSMAFEISRFDPESAAETIRDRRGMLGRRTAPGELIEISRS